MALLPDPDDGPDAPTAPGANARDDDHGSDTVFEAMLHDNHQLHAGPFERTGQRSLRRLGSARR